jgi:hypothetical protein
MKLMTPAIVCLLFAVGNARADLYLSLSDGEWGKVNVLTGVFTPLGNSGPMGDVAINPLTGQGYGISINSFGVLETINVANGNSAPVGQSTYTNNLGASVEGDLYETNGDLLRINQSTGGTTDLGFFSSATIFDIALNASDEIFATDSSNLYERALGASGPATFLGNTGFSRVFGLAFENFVLYGFGVDSLGAPVLFSINQTTGAGTLVAHLSGGGFDGGEVTFGATSSEPLGPNPSAVPEPSSLVLFGLGGLFTGAYCARRQKRLSRNPQPCC